MFKVSCQNKIRPVRCTGGSLAMILGTDVRLESPNPTPFIYQAKWKTWPIHILPISKIDPIHILFLKIDPIHILFFKFYPFIYFLGEKDTPLIYFWCKNDTHSYTGRPEKYTQFQPHICIYLCNGSYPPPPPVVRWSVSFFLHLVSVWKPSNIPKFTRGPSIFHSSLRNKKVKFNPQFDE